MTPRQLRRGLDWLGGGIRLWVTTRHVHARPNFGRMVLASGLNTWGSFLTPSQTGGGPVMIWGMRRHVPYPEAMTSALAGFVATLLFLATAGPLALALGAGQSLREHGIAPAITVLGLFRVSLWTFIAVGMLILSVIVFPRHANRALQRVALAFSRRRPSLSARVETWAAGIDRTQRCLRAFLTGRGLMTLLVAVL